MCEELQNQPNLTGPHQNGTLFEFWECIFASKLVNYQILVWVLISTNCDDFHAFQHVFGSIYNVLGSKKAALKVSIPLGSFGALSNRSIRVTSCRFSVRKRPKQCEVGILGTTTAIPQTKLTQKTFVSTVVPLPS